VTGPLLIALLLPAFGFAWRGTSLLLMTRAKPHRLFSASGVVAAICMFMFAFVSPILISECAKIFAEFGVDLAALTGSTMSLVRAYMHLGWVVRCFLAVGLSLCVLMTPEILFYRPERVSDGGT
jgi:hypothetical protein